MKRKTWLILLLVLLAALVYLWYTGRLDTGAEPEVAAPAAYAPADGSAADHLIVDLRNDVGDAEVKALERRYGLTLRPNSRFSLVERLYRAALGRLPASRLLARLRQEPAVERAELDELYGLPPLEHAPARVERGAAPAWKGFPNDPKFQYQWHLRQIGLDKAWPRAQGAGVIVAVIDTGVAYKNHGRVKGVPDLAGTEIVPGYDFVNDNELALDDHGHGTHVAGTIAQATNNGVGVAGVAFGAKIMPLKVLSSRGFGSVADIAEAIRFATDHGAKIINMSLGGGRSSKVLADAVKYAAGKGVLVVCAAGNDGRGHVSYPAAYPGAVAVAATQFDESTTFYSNWGKEIALAAPGGNTRVDQNGDGLPDGVLQNTIVPGHPDENDYLMFMGTSMASPHVAGVAALVMQSGVTDPKAVLKLLKSTARHPKKVASDEHYGAGIVDAGAALTKTSTTWGGYRVGLAGLFGLLLLLGARSGGAQVLRFGPTVLLGLLFGSAGLFFLPVLGVSASGALGTLATQGLPAWDSALLGAAGHGNPIFYSMGVPLLLAGLFYGAPRLRGLLFGLSVGVGAHLAFAALFPTADLTWIPNHLGLESLWLAGNALGCLGLAALLARK